MGTVRGEDKKNDIVFPNKFTDTGMNVSFMPIENYGVGPTRVVNCAVGTWH
jgi:hypothetical protein